MAFNLTIEAMAAGNEKEEPSDEPLILKCSETLGNTAIKIK
jgi:hypothetical protein